MLPSAPFPPVPSASLHPLRYPPAPEIVASTTITATSAMAQPRFSPAAMGSVHRRRPRYAGPLVGVYPIPQILGIIDNSQPKSTPGQKGSTTSPAVIGPGKELGNFGLDGSHQQ